VTTAQLAVVAAAVFSASLIQVLSGFGFSLLSVPLMTLAVPTKEAVVVSTLMGVGVTTWQAWHGRREVDRVLAKRMVLAAYLGMPLGLWAFIAVDEAVLRLSLGVSVLVAVVLLVTRIDLRTSGPALDLGAGFVSGVLNTSLSTNGPPLVFALQARGLEPDPFRSTINTVFACCNVVGISLFLAAGRVDADSVRAALIAVPALLAGQFCGYPLRKYVRGDRFRVLVLVLLVIAGFSAIINALR
jgi:uncharacterized protein